MTPDELRNAVARVLSFPDEADVVFAAIRDAGFAIVPTRPTEAMVDAGNEETEAYFDVSDIWDAMLKASQKGKSWPDIRGIAPDATGDLSNEDFVRQMRDEWPDRQEGKP